MHILEVHLDVLEAGWKQQQMPPKSNSDSYAWHYNKYKEVKHCWVLTVSKNISSLKPSYFRPTQAEERYEEKENEGRNIGRGEKDLEKFPKDCNWLFWSC